MGIIIGVVIVVVVCFFGGILLFAVMSVPSRKEVKAAEAAVAEFKVEVRRRELMGWSENAAQAAVQAEVSAFYAAGGGLEVSGMHLSNGRTRYSRPYDPSIVTAWPTKGDPSAWDGDWHKPVGGLRFPKAPGLRSRADHR